MFVGRLRAEGLTVDQSAVPRLMKQNSKHTVVCLLTGLWFNPLTAANDCCWYKVRSIVVHISLTNALYRCVLSQPSLIFDVVLCVFSDMNLIFL